MMHNCCLDPVTAVSSEQELGTKTKTVVDPLEPVIAESSEQEKGTKTITYDA